MPVHADEESTRNNRYDDTDSLTETVPEETSGTASGETAGESSESGQTAASARQLMEEAIASESAPDEEDTQAPSTSETSTGVPEHPAVPTGAGTTGNPTGSLDEINERTLQTYAGARQKPAAVREEDAAFDTIQELMHPDSGPDSKNSSGTAAADPAKKARINELRRGNLYKAVVVLRTLEKTGKNPLAGGLFRRGLRRMMNSSSLDTVSDINKLASSAIGMGTALDKDTSHASAWGLAGMVSNLITCVTSIRSGAAKIRKLIPPVPFSMQKLLTGAGLVCDILTVISKCCSIARTISNMQGWSSLAKRVLDYVTVSLNMATQVIGLSTSTFGLAAKSKGYHNLKTGTKKLWCVIGPHLAGALQITGNPSAEALNKVKESDRRAAAAGALRQKRPDEPFYDQFLSYILMSRRKDNMKIDIINTASGLATLIVAFGASLASASNYGVNGASLYEPKPGVGRAVPDNIDAAVTAKNFGVAAATFNGTSTSIKLAAQAAGRLRRNSVKNASLSDEPEIETAGRGLLNKVKILTEDEYGLKGLAQSPAEDEQEKAIRMYDSAEKVLTTAGVSLPSLIKASSVNDFKKLLTAAI